MGIRMADTARGYTIGPMAATTLGSQFWLSDGCYLLGISIHLHIKKYVKNVIHMLTKGSGGMDIISTLYRHYIDIMQMA